MKTITQLFNEAWKKKVERNWEYVYIMVDLHGVVLRPNYHVENDLDFIHPQTESVLRYLSDAEDVILILWSSSHTTEISSVLTWMLKKGIAFSYVNENPLERNTEYADFSEKPYFSIGLDDKFGFEPSDWEELTEWIKVREMKKME